MIDSWSQFSLVESPKKIPHQVDNASSRTTILKSQRAYLHPEEAKYNFEFIFWAGVKTTARIIFVSTLFALCSIAQDRLSHFSGRISKGEKFQRDIASGLQFVLMPAVTAGQGLSLDSGL